MIKNIIVWLARLALDILGPPTPPAPASRRDFRGHIMAEVTLQYVVVDNNGIITQVSTLTEPIPNMTAAMARIRGELAPSRVLFIDEASPTPIPDLVYYDGTAFVPRVAAAPDAAEEAAAAAAAVEAKRASAAAKRAEAEAMARELTLKP